MVKKKKNLDVVFVVKNAFEKSLRPALIFLSRCGHIRMGGALRDVTKGTQSIAIAGKRYQYEAKMPNRCVAAGCSITARLGIALY